jgi:hypothetical protein
MKNLIAIILSASLALGAAAVPARAGNAERQAARVILGATLLYFLVDGLQQNQANAASRATNNTYSNSYANTNSYSGEVGDDDGDHYRWSQRYGQKVLPASCAFDVRARHNRRIEVLGSACLADWGRNPRRLPAECRIELSGARGTTYAYGSDCLLGYGYRIEARR